MSRKPRKNCERVRAKVALVAKKKRLANGRKAPRPNRAKKKVFGGKKKREKAYQACKRKSWRLNPSGKTFTRLGGEKFQKKNQGGHEETAFARERDYFRRGKQNNPGNIKQRKNTEKKPEGRKKAKKVAEEMARGERPSPMQQQAQSRGVRECRTGKMMFLCGRESEKEQSGKRSTGRSRGGEKGFEPATLKLEQPARKKKKCGEENR